MCEFEVNCIDENLKIWGKEGEKGKRSIEISFRELLCIYIVQR